MLPLETAGSAVYFFADDLALLASTEQGLQYVLDRFGAACDQTGIKIITQKTEVQCIFRNLT